jgi:hypothetical protein
MRDALETHLALLRRQRRLTAWSDRLIGAGEAIDDAISDELIRAKVVLLLISADFIASDYCYGVELAAALAGHEAGKQRVIPIIVDHCDWKSAPFAKLKVLPTDGKPIRAHRPQSRGWADAVTGVRDAIDSLASSQPRTRQAAAGRAQRKTAPPATPGKSSAGRGPATPVVDWLTLVNIRQAWRNCRIDHYRDWYRDPWDWPEWEWLVKRNPTYLIRSMEAPVVAGAATLDVAKEEWRVRPGLILQPLDRLVYQGLTDALSERAIGKMRPWVYGVRLAPSDPRPGSYLRGDHQAKAYRRRLSSLAARYPFALRADIADFFASVDIDRLVRQLQARAPKAQERVAAALSQLLHDGQSSGELRGLPQRYLASSVLANLYLAPLDDSLDLYAAEGRRPFHYPRVLRWMDDVWVFARDQRTVEDAQNTVQETATALSLSLARSKTAVFSGNDLVGAAANFELSAIDGELIESDGQTSRSLDALLEELLANPTNAPRTHIIFATTRMRAHRRFERVPEFAERCHLMPQAADALGRLFRDAGTYRGAGWYVDLAKRFMKSSDWAVAQLGAMFPADETPPNDVVDLFEYDLLSSGSVALTGLAAHRLASWKGGAARDAIRTCGMASESPHIRRIIALTDVGLGADEGFVDQLLDVPECRPTREMLVDRRYEPVRTSRDFAGVT